MKLIAMLCKGTISDAFGKNSRPTFHVLVAHQNSTRELRDFWVSKTLASTLNKDTSNLFILFIGNLSTNSFLHPIQWSIDSFYFLCFSCCNCKRVLIPVDVISWRDKIKTLNALSDRVPWSVSGIKASFPALWSKQELTFRNYLCARETTKRYIPDKAMAEYVMPNSSYKNWWLFPNIPDTDDGSLYADTLRKTTCHEFSTYVVEDYIQHNANAEGFYLKRMCYGPIIHLESSGNPALVRGRDEFTFISCGITPWQKTSLYGFFSSFDSITWACIIVFILVWPVVLTLIESDFNYKEVLWDSQTWLLGFVLLLEQGHCLVENRTGKGPLYYTCGLTLLVLIILSNAYKGKNIELLSESFKVIPYTNIQQILRDEYKILTRLEPTFNAESNNTKVYGDVFILGPEYESFRHEFGWQVSDSLLKELDKKVELHPDSQALFEFFSDTSYPEIVRKCNQVALVGWTSDVIQTIYKQIEEKVDAPARVYLGSEPLFRRNTGWWLNHWRNPEIPQRLAYLKQSGIPDEWISIAKIDKGEVPAMPVSLSLNGNVLVQFYCLSCGLLVAGGCFVVESSYKWISLATKLTVISFMKLKELFKILELLLNHFLKCLARACVSTKSTNAITYKMGSAFKECF